MHTSCFTCSDVVQIHFAKKTSGWIDAYIMTAAAQWLQRRDRSDFPPSVGEMGERADYGRRQTPNLVQSIPPRCLLRQHDIERLPIPNRFRPCNRDHRALSPVATKRSRRSRPARRYSLPLGWWLQPAEGANSTRTLWIQTPRTKHRSSRHCRDRI